MSKDHVLNVSIVTPQETAFEGTALAVSVPGSKSPFQVLFNHAPIISSLDVGVLKVEDPSNQISAFACKEGFIEVLRNNINIVVQGLEPASGIDVSEAEEVVNQARQKYNDVSGRDARGKALDELHWAEARWRAAKLQMGETSN